MEELVQAPFECLAACRNASGWNCVQAVCVPSVYLLLCQCLLVIGFAGYQMLVHIGEKLCLRNSDRNRWHWKSGYTTHSLASTTSQSRSSSSSNSDSNTSTPYKTYPPGVPPASVFSNLTSIAAARRRQQRQCIGRHRKGTRTRRHLV